MSENDPSLSNPAITPDQSTVASQQAQPHTPTNVAGSAMLDAQAAAGGNEPEGDPTNFPIATNFPKAGVSGDPKTAGASTIMGPDSTDEQNSEKGSVNLQNNPDIPSDEMQGTLPNTDPVGMPIDPETNFPE
ncbi:MAG: hypothetical protein KME32_16800 [Mojavia pulchra JT2-VF2]|jgi:hypothetical protein|uniref:Uncharacterized protein n=1 Tax=Mojavia pulchra JT2-VF2 TaxID=287848 RepID=A0A951Q1U2_9NOST|nr:hypothetical protein [Mojavia pulchra JT2-VF2]